MSENFLLHPFVDVRNLFSKFVFEYLYRYHVGIKMRYLSISCISSIKIARDIVACTC